MNRDIFLNITIRSRVLFGICCLQRAIYHWEYENLNWQILFEFLIRYPNGDETKNLGLWHENESECTPACILDNKPYEECHFEYISKSEFEYFENLYKGVNNSICKIIDLIGQTGTQALYGGVRDGSPNTAGYVFEIIEILAENNIEMPDIKDFEQIGYENPENDRVVWGDKIEIDIIGKILNNNKEASQPSIWRFRG